MMRRVMKSKSTKGHKTMKGTPEHKWSTSTMRHRMATYGLGLAVGAVVALLLAPSAWAQADASVRFKVLHSFTGGADGAVPAAGLVLDAAGNLYGTAALGGKAGFGTVFEINKETGKFTVLHAFRGGQDGNQPVADLLLDNEGNLYGTTGLGGSTSCLGQKGCGTVFEVTNAGHEKVLYAFKGGKSDGSLPVAGLVMDSSGNLYGTTNYDGTGNVGTAYKLDTHRKETVLHNFQGAPNDGTNPKSELLLDTDGNLWGTTYGGGSSNNGTVFKINKKDKTTIVYSFTGGSDGGWPAAGLVQDSEGNLYGTGEVPGVVFEVNQAGQESVVWDFGSTENFDGGAPEAQLLLRNDGILYGTTQVGGYNDVGTVFEVTTAGAETVLYRFLGATDGGFPVADLVMDSSGNLYGTASAYGKHGYGVVFEISPRK